MRAVGIDLGAQAVWAVAAEDGRFAEGAVFGVELAELDRLRRWCADAVVAIDAPAGPSEGRHLHDETLAAKFRVGRCAEVALRRAGHSVAWVTGAGPFAPWVETGFAVYEALDDLDLLEVFPHATFVEMLGHRPPPKSTLLGRRARLDTLDDLGLPPGSELWSHDGLDAAAACLVAVDRTRGTARELRCDDHEGGSAMWLPDPARRVATR